MKRFLIILFKYVAPLAIVGWLLYSASRDDSFERLWKEPKNWALLAAAAAINLSAVMLTFVRWFFLVRALNLPFRMRDAFRLGFLGYLFNMIAPGAVGGDLFKAVFIAREQPGRRAAAVSSVIVDRLVGLYALFILVSCTFLFTDVGRQAREGDFRPGCYAVWGVTIGCSLFSLIFMLPALTDGWFAKKLESIPKLGKLIVHFHDSVRLYRSGQRVLWLAMGLSLCIHSLTSVSYFCIARALTETSGYAPTLAAHFIIAPLSLLVGILPVMMNGLGLVEGAMKALYREVPSGLPAGEVVTAGLGLLVSLTNRVIMILTAGIGAGFYLFRRREVTVLIHDAEELAEGHELPPVANAEQAGDALAKVSHSSPPLTTPAT